MAFGLRRAKMHVGLIVRAVIDVGYGGHPTCPSNKILENIVYFLGNYHVKFRHFRTYHVKFGNFVNFSGKYNKNSGILITFFRANIM